MKNILLLLISLILFFSCEKKEFFFNGDIYYIKQPQSDTLKGNKIELDGIYTGSMCVYDSVMLFFSHKYSDYFGYVYDLNLGTHINSVIKKGRGTNEYNVATFSEQFESNKKICMWFYDWSRGKSFLTDLSNNMNIKTVDIAGLDNKSKYPYMRIFVLDNDLVLVYSQGDEKHNSLTNFIPPKYYKFNYKTKERITHYDMFKSFNIHKDMPPQMCLYSVDRIKPDKSKLVMAMRNLYQINILDINTGIIKGFQIKNSSDSKFLKDDFESIIPFYAHVCVDDSLIFGIVRNENSTITINVFDWEGNLKNVLHIDEDAATFAFDPVNKILYSKNDMEEVYVYDLKYLYKK